MAAASPGDSSHHLLDLQGEDAALGPSVPDVSGGEALAIDTAPPPMWTRDWLHFAKAELTWLLRLAAPMSGTFLLNNISYIVMLLFVGRLGKTELAAAGLGFSVFNLIAYSFGLGLCCALDTFCSQAYGAGAYHRLGIYLQRGIVVFTAYIILLLPLMFNSYSILVALGQEPRIAELASFVCKIMAVSLWPLLLYECLKKFLSAQGISSPLLIASVLYISTVTLGLYVTIVVMDLGFAGAPLTMATANALVPLYLLVQAHYWHPTAMQQTWRGWTWECMRGWGEYLRMGIPAAILLCTEWWAFEILIMLSGVLGVAQLAASQVHLSVLNFIYMFPLGLSIAANTRVGNLLGAGEPYHARGVVYVTLMFTWGMMLGICFGLLALRNQLGKFFSTDASVVHLIAAILPIASFTVVLDGNQAVCQGVLRAAGLQKLGAILNFCSYYVICIPLAVVMAFVFKWDVWGLWISIAVAEVTVVILFWWAIWMVDWKEQSKLAQSRSSVDDVSLGHH